MVYRETEKTRLRKAKLRADILQAAYEQVAEAGFCLPPLPRFQPGQALPQARYTNTSSPRRSCLPRFRSATAKEVSKVKAAVELPGSALARLKNGIAVFASCDLGRQIAGGR